MSEQTKNRIFWGVLILMIIYAVVATYIRVFVKMDYLIMNEVSCDTSSESCFVYTASEACAESEDEASCLEETEDWYYKYIYKKAANIPFCEYNPELGESCPELTCIEGESEEECYYEYCEEGCAEAVKETVEETVEIEESIATE
jgi:hypothetical protein